ncbi:hypothetical protein MPTK1_2g21890 [Marchantia polymorpha subsp. ruderalis]|nr:hypothetical protein MARPO_0040s0026 [Marchantia polymorpha]BBN03236.1 hypothetical protein Mp_2g21890 [Marchantia polymorpha subsp. ruderalis]|eukprot:PTQ40341.1 hypothetical protein MARPO_0040s0026 [Marchantia polymorpha]
MSMRMRMMMMTTMRRRREAAGVKKVIVSLKWGLIVLSIMVLCLASNANAQQCEANCKTNNCDADGVCQCLLPDPDSVMNGDRSFQGGVFCDTQSTMCDGTNSFWCESGGVCNEIVQGENYTCSCDTGFAGVHCENKGDACGDSFCFNGGECIGILSTSCDCPPEFLGARDCSLPTFVAPPPAGSPPESSAKHHAGEWYRPLVIVLSIVVVSLCLGSFFFKWQKKRAEHLSRSRFHELRQVQMADGPDFYDDGEDDPFADTPKAPRKQGP